MNKFLLKLLLTLSLLMALALATFGDEIEEQTLRDQENDDQEIIDEESDRLPTFLRGTGRLLGQQMTCDKYPRICRAKGSPGPDCCKKKCVNVSTDRLNCGMCGKKCKFSETCCKGKCVNTRSDKKNCGGCHKKCKKGNVCVYGMCSYA